MRSPLRWGPSRTARIGGLMIGASVVGAGLGWLLYSARKPRTPAAWPHDGRQLARPRRGWLARLLGRKDRSLEDLARRIY